MSSGEGDRILPILHKSKALEKKKLYSNSLDGLKASQGELITTWSKREISSKMKSESRAEQSPEAIPRGRDL